MKRSLAALLFATAAVLGTSPAVAQEAQPAPGGQQQGDGSALRDLMSREFPQEVLDLGLQLVKLSGTGKTFDQLLPNIADEAKNSFIRANPQMQLGIIEVVDRVALSMVSLRPQLDQMLARAWASGFTPEEMQALVDFYGTDIGKKFSEVQPRLMAVEMATAQAWSRSVLRELTKRVEAELRAAMSAEQRALQGDTAGPAPQAPADAGAPAQAAGSEAAPDLGGALAPVQ